MGARECEITVCAKRSKGQTRQSQTEPQSNERRMMHRTESDRAMGCRAGASDVHVFMQVWAVWREAYFTLNFLAR